MNVRWGYSSLGLPLFEPAARERMDEILDVVLGGGLYQTLEVHLEEPIPAPRLGSPLLDRELRSRIARIAQGIRDRGGAFLLGLGSRFLLSSSKHEPSLIHPDPQGRALRVQLLEEALDLAAETGSSALIFLAGPSAHSTLPALEKYRTPEWGWLRSGLERLLGQAEQRGVTLAPEAHSAHLFSRLEDLAELKRALPSPRLGFTADTVHQNLMEPLPLREVYERWAAWITHVQLDNSSTARYVPGGAIVKTALDQPGSVDMQGAVAGLRAGAYQGTVSVEFLRVDHPSVDPLEYCRRIGAWLQASFS